MLILNTKKIKKQKAILTSVAFLMLSASCVQSTAILDQEEQKVKINAHHLPPIVNGRNVKIAIIDYEGHHGRHVFSSLHNIAPHSQLLFIGLNSDPDIKDKVGGNAQVIAAIDKAIASKVKFISMSLRISPDGNDDDKITEAMRQALLRARNAGIGIIKSAGNDSEFTGSTAYTHSLANLLDEMNGNMLLAIATRYTLKGQEKIASFSNNAGIGHDYMVAAPGTRILAFYPNHEFEEMSGTSMAAPIVTGSAALVQGVNPNLSPKEVLDSIRQSARTTSLQDHVSLPAGRYGCGVVDVGNALTVAKVVQQSKH